jgi:hypothetical protein
MHLCAATPMHFLSAVDTSPTGLAMVCWSR